MVSRWWKRRQQSFQRWTSLALCLAVLISSVPLAAEPASRMSNDADRSGPAPVLASTLALASSSHPHDRGVARAQPPDPVGDPTLGTLLGRVVRATDNEALAGVQVVARGVPDAFPLPLYVPLLLTRTIAPPARNFRVRAMPAVLTAPPSLDETVVFTTTTDALGDFHFAIPAGDYTLAFTGAGYTPDERDRPVRANEILRLEDIRLHPQDPVVTEVGASGGTANNSLGNSSVSFPPGALAGAEDVRVTYVDNPDLPGFFPDGSAPMGFSSFEPEGTAFPAGKEVLWTVEYTGTLPVGTDTLCYWWDGKEQRWRDPVPGKVVDLGNGKKGLQAKVPHFSFYGHAVPGIAGQQPGQAGDPTVTTANIGEGSSGFT